MDPDAFSLAGALPVVLVVFVLGWLWWVVGVKMLRLTIPKRLDEQGRMNRITLSLAALLFLSPWLMGYADLRLAEKTAWMSAIVVGAVSAAATLRFAEWEEWVNFLAGLWLMLAPWLLHFHEQGHAIASFATIGAIITTISVSDLWAEHHRATKPSDIAGER